MKQAAGAVLFLPDGRIVFQRRTKDAPSGAGLLGFFGGMMESGETPEETMRRELGEEIGLDISSLSFSFACKVVVSVSGRADGHALTCHLFRATIPHMNFKVFEGDGAEAFSLDELRTRTDLANATRAVLQKMYGEILWA